MGSFKQKFLSDLSSQRLKTFIVCLFLLACAPPKAEDVETECVVNPDQSNTFRGHWSARPVPLAVEAVDFSSTELVQLQAAIDQWNTFFEASKGFRLFLNGSSSLAQTSSGGTRITSSTVCANPALNANGFTRNIMIYKNRTTWNYGSSVIAMTSICPVTTANSQFRILTSAVMEVNYRDFFSSGKPVPDLQSIITHELGHMLGLDHSCSGSNCSNSPDDYRDAVMYPSLGFDGALGRVKRDLQKNDQQRANCLY